MKRIRDVIRLHAQYLSKRKIAQSLGISRDAVTNYLTRAENRNIKWPLPDSMDDFELENTLFPPVKSLKRKTKVEPDWEEIHFEMRKKGKYGKGATLQGLHAEYLEENPDGLAYSSFSQGYRKFKKTLKKYMRQSHLSGECAFVDYSGRVVKIYNLKTGATKDTEIFVGVLGASNYTFAYARWSQKIEDWVMCHAKMFEYFGGVPNVVVCDNLKSAVTKVSKIDPVINETYLHMAAHYDTRIFAARPYKPKDKSQAEGAVLLVQRWILFTLRHRKFTSLNELNEAISELLEKFNNRPFQKLSGCRRSAFEALDQPALKPLPNTRYEYTKFMKCSATITMSG